MKKLAMYSAIAGALMVSSLASAQTQMPLPAYARTYSFSGHTRGYWFEAPIDFCIVALRVPDEMGHGLQNFAVVRFDGNVPPPAFSGTTNAFQVLEYIVAEPSAARIPVEIQVRSGEIIGIMGAAGDSSIMRNSYGPSGPFQSDIFGRPVTLTRMGMQHNLVTFRPSDIWTEPPSPVSRVEMYYDAQCAPTCPCACDFDPDPLCDIFDFLEFQNEFVGGCP